MKWTRLQGLLLFPIVLFMVSYAGAHCEIPCGIYDDQMRVKMMTEHMTTIEKSMQQILLLGKNGPVNHNQLIRWVSNKEKHCNELQEIITQYFMTQRIKPDTKKYVDKLTILHKMLVASMKCKQTTDVSYIATLRSLLKAFEAVYF